MNGLSKCSNHSTSTKICLENISCTTIDVVDVALDLNTVGHRRGQTLLPRKYNASQT